MEENTATPERCPVKPWKSKTLWTSVISIAAILIQSKTSYVVSPEIQAYALISVNMILRCITKEPIAWS